MKSAAVLRWIARTWSIASLLFVIAVASASSAQPAMSELTASVFFPIGVVAGLVIGWRWSGLGGAISVVSLALFYAWMIGLDGRLTRGPYF